MFFQKGGDLSGPAIWWAQPKQPPSASAGARPTWLTNFGDQPLIWWPNPGNGSATGLGHIRQWILNQGNLPIFWWQPLRYSTAATRAFKVSGQVLAEFQGPVSEGRFTVFGQTIAQFLGAEASTVYIIVRGKVAATFTGVTNALTTGDFTVSGAVNAQFLLGQQAEFTVTGQVLANFFTTAAQPNSCIVGNPQTGNTAPNFTH